LRRNDFGGGLTNGESVDGGFEELREFCFSCRFNSALSASNTATFASSLAIISVCHTTNAASSS
jgi:hypothetical protein